MIMCGCPIYSAGNDGFLELNFLSVFIFVEYATKMGATRQNPSQHCFKDRNYCLRMKKIFWIIVSKELKVCVYLIENELIMCSVGCW